MQLRTNVNHSIQRRRSRAYRSLFSSFFNLLRREQLLPSSIFHLSPPPLARWVMCQTWPGCHHRYSMNPSCLFRWTQGKLPVLGFVGGTPPILGAIKEAAMGVQNGYRRAGSRRETALRYPFWVRPERGFDGGIISWR